MDGGKKKERVANSEPCGVNVTGHTVRTSCASERVIVTRRASLRLFGATRDIFCSPPLLSLWPVVFLSCTTISISTSYCYSLRRTRLPWPRSHSTPLPPRHHTILNPQIPQTPPHTASPSSNPNSLLPSPNSAPSRTNSSPSRTDHKIS